jgi:hypothetical protein
MPDMRDNDPPLTADQLNKLAKSKALVNKALTRCQQLADCGVDCRAQHAWCQALGQRIDAFLNNFGSQPRKR